MKNHRINALIAFSILLTLLACTACLAPLPTPSPIEDRADETTGAGMPVDGPLPYSEDIVLWLDAGEGVVTDGDGNVTTWADRRSGEAFTLDGSLVEAGMNDRPVVRMSGGSGLTFEAGLDNGPSTIYVVYQRGDEQTNGPNWQRLISVWDGEDAKDLYWPSYAYMIDRGRNAIEPQIVKNAMLDDARGTFSVGMNAVTGEDNFHGDIAEVIVYSRATAPAESTAESDEAIIAYLREKWGAAYDPDLVYERRGPLSEPVERITDDYPLSDQTNSEGWTLFEPWSDEFDDGVLDTDKWLPHNHEWYGRAPARYLPENVSEGAGSDGGGSIKLTMKKDPSLPHEEFYNNGEIYKDYSSATLSSLDAKRYGYIEARTKAGVGSSAFWLYAESLKNDKLDKLEIDVYELGGLEKGYEELYNMNTWKWVKDGVEGRFQNPGKWESGVKFSEDFHVFGFKWTEDVLQWYVDGVLVRSIPNDIFHSPLLLLSDVETMPDWFGIPADEHLPGYHEIDYVRTWVNDETIDTWQDDYRLLHDPRTDNPTADYVSQFPGHVDEGVSE